MNVVDLFAGPGGWDQGVLPLGIRPHGVEWDKQACATARAAGHRRHQADVSSLAVPNDMDGLIASPPCQGFSTAGKGEGRKDSELLLRAIPDLYQPERFAPGIEYLHEHMHDDRSLFALEPLRWVVQGRPTWTTWEQVPAVLPIWQQAAKVLTRLGYSVWTGNVTAEMYGVPQTRRRAILIASLDHEVGEPTPTHSRYYSRTPEKLDDGVEKWVSMAEALGWGVDSLVGFPRRTDGRGDVVELGGTGYRARDLRPADRPAQVVTEKSRSWQRFQLRNNTSANAAVRPQDHPAPTMYFGKRLNKMMWEPMEMGDVRSANGTIRRVDRPAPTLTASMDNGNFQWRAAVAAEVEPRVNNQSGTAFDLAWPADRPAPTLAGRELVTMPGANANRFNGATKSRNDGIRVTVQEAAVLQSFPADYPWQGTKTDQFRQVGDAVPPLLAYHVVQEATR